MINKKTNLFTWNDLVITRPNAAIRYFPGEITVICGMEQIKSEKLAKEFDMNIGEWLYTVEFGAGSSIEIPEKYLEKYEE